MHPEIDKLIQMALADGQVKDKEREIILRKAEKLGIDIEEVEMYLEGRVNIIKLNSKANGESIDNKIINIKMFEKRKVEPVKPANLNNKVELENKAQNLENNIKQEVFKLNELKIDLEEVNQEIINLETKLYNIIEKEEIFFYQSLNVFLTDYLIKLELNFKEISLNIPKKISNEICLKFLNYNERIDYLITNVTKKWTINSFLKRSFFYIVIVVSLFPIIDILNISKTSFKTLLVLLIGCFIYYEYSFIRKNIIVNVNIINKTKQNIEKFDIENKHYKVFTEYKEIFNMISKIKRTLN